MSESPVFAKMFDFVAWLIPLTAKFPREQRFIVAQALSQSVFAAQESLVRAAQVSEPHLAIPHLEDVAAKLGMARFQVRLSERLGLITTSQYEYASERLTELARLIQGWRNRCRAHPKQTVSGAAPM